VDGKVCISLLGSTNATDESQRWNPDLSSLAQVLISIQSQILGVGDPYFNEGKPTL
jgi:ubiquitin-protein ligase